MLNLDGAKGKEAIYGWEKQVRDESAEIKMHLDRQWSERQHKRRFDDLNKKMREAAKAGDAETIRALIDTGISVNEVSATYRNSPLQYACREGRTEAVLVLIRARGDAHWTSFFLIAPLVFQVLDTCQHNDAHLHDMLFDGNYR